MPNTHAHYLRDLGQLLRDEALKTRAEQAHGGDFERGKMFAYYSVVSLMQQQATAFGLSLNEIGLEDLDPERDLLTP